MSTSDDVTVRELHSITSTESGDREPSSLSQADVYTVRAALGGLPLEWEGDGEEDDGAVISVSGAPLFKPFWPGDFPCNDVDDDELAAKQVRDTHALARVIVAATNAVLYPPEAEA